MLGNPGAKMAARCHPERGDVCPAAHRNATNIPYVHPWADRLWTASSRQTILNATAIASAVKNRQCGGGCLLPR
jgi:hypothetical protein